MPIWPRGGVSYRVSPGRARGTRARALREAELVRTDSLEETARSAGCRYALEWKVYPTSARHTTMAASKWNEGEVVLRLLLTRDEQLPATIEPGRRGLDEPSPRPGAARARPAPRGASLRRGAGPPGAAAAPPAGHRRPRAPRSPAGRRDHRGRARPPGPRQGRRAVQPLAACALAAGAAGHGATLAPRRAQVIRERPAGGLPRARPE